MGMENLMVVAFERVFGFCHQQEKNISWINKHIRNISWNKLSLINQYRKKKSYYLLHMASQKYLIWHSTMNRLSIFLIWHSTMNRSCIWQEKESIQYIWNIKYFYLNTKTCCLLLYKIDELFLSA